MPVYVATKKVLYPVMVAQFNFSNLDSWPSRDPGPLLQRNNATVMGSE